MHLCVQEIVNVFDENRADRVKRLMSRETIFRQTLQRRTNDRLIVQGELILDNCVHHCVNPAGTFRQVNSDVSMILLNQERSFALVEGEPFLRVWDQFRIVAVHCGIACR